MIVKNTSFNLVSSSDNVNWPSGDCRPIGLLAVTPEQIEQILGAPLERGTEEGLGPWQGIGIRLQSGRIVGLLWYDFSPEPRGVAIEADAQDNFAEARQECLSTLGLAKSQLLWVPDE